MASEDEIEHTGLNLWIFERVAVTQKDYRMMRASKRKKTSMYDVTWLRRLLN